MALKSFSKGYLLSSTPLQSPGDSGYFGSGHRRNKSNALNSCSPVKESIHRNLSEDISFTDQSTPNVKIEQNLNFENLTKNESLSSVEVNELSELEFTSPNFSSQFEPSPFSLEEDQKIHAFHGSYSNSRCTLDSLNSLSADNDISYKLFDYESSSSSGSNDFKPCASRNYIISENIITPKKRKVDFIHELSEKNCYSITSYILSFLSAKELCIACCVSKEWNKVILNDSKANTRRENFITERLTFLNGPSKENRKGMKYGPAREHKNVLTDKTNIEVSPNAVSVNVSNNSKFDSFMRESRNSKSRLLKCPKCFHASKRLNENHYMCTCCSYNFCSNCLDPVSTRHTCFKPQLPNIVIGSKKSKRNLKRL